MYNHFIDFAKNLHNESLLKTDAAFASHRQSRLAAFEKHFQAVSICPRAEYMHCYVMEMAGDAYLPKVPKGEDTEIVNVSGFNKLNKIDYDTRNEVISERLKLLMEQYVPQHQFEPIVYWDKEKGEQAIFWRFRPPIYNDFQAAYRNDGLVSHISFPNNNTPLVFTARSPKGVRSIVVCLAVAESALRRGILGLKFTKLLELKEAYVK
ncbi:MAG: hypothetical protein FWG40_03235 [Peptococcaceae bacterium]|nr:hypothetical protein [Peptococcaceae bacterium]